MNLNELEPTDQVRKSQRCEMTETRLKQKNQYENKNNNLAHSKKNNGCERGYSMAKMGAGEKWKKKAFEAKD